MGQHARLGIALVLLDGDVGEPMSCAAAKAARAAATADRLSLVMMYVHPGERERGDCLPR